MPQLSFFRYSSSTRSTRRPLSNQSLLLATAMVALGVLLVCMPSLVRGIEQPLQHQVESIRLALDNLRGAFAPDSSCQPACRSMLLRWLKRAAVGCHRYLAIRQVPKTGGLCKLEKKGVCACPNVFVVPGNPRY